MEKTGTNKWCKGVQTILCRYGMGQYYNQYPINKTSIISQFKQKSAMQARLEMLEDMSPRRSHMFRELLARSDYGEPARYFDLLSPRKATVIAKFRLRNTYIGVETNCWKNSSSVYGDLCEVCGVPDTKVHFALECPQFDYLRTKYIPSYFRCSPSFEGLCQLLDGSDRNSMNGLAQFLRRATPIKKETYKCLKTLNAEDSPRLDETFLVIPDS